MRRRYLEVSRAPTALLVSLQYLHILFHTGLALFRQRVHPIRCFHLMLRWKSCGIRLGKISAHLMKIWLAARIVVSDD